MFQIPKLDVPVADSDEITAVFRECDRLDFRTDFVARYFNIVFPIPHVDYHIVLRTYADYVLVCRRKRLKN